MSDPIKVPEGPVTRARAKRFKESFNGFMREVWNQESHKRPVEGEEPEPKWKTVISSCGTDCHELQHEPGREQPVAPFDASYSARGRESAPGRATEAMGNETGATYSTT
ncbi:hypothetical protein C2S51_024530 [Perilla frutescens var. frutescens]|nr:hypothetical protein C2S51_024530 [Perilla frutescens var. frutescens]